MQKALDSLIQMYLEKETRSELFIGTNNAAVANKLDIPDSPMDPEQEDNFLQALYKCLEEKGIMRELQAFMRQKLIDVLKGVLPNLVSTRCEGNLGRVATTLIEEFMCCHKLLFTFSVLGTELEDGLTLGKGNFGKMPLPSVETLLADIGVKRNSTLSHFILSTYSQNENWSLLECILDSAPWANPGTNPIRNDIINENEKAVALTAIEAKLKEINEKYTEKAFKIKNNEATVEEKLNVLTEAMEFDKEAQIEIRMEKFCKEEVAKIRDEIETELKFQILQKEKELLRSFETQVTHLKRSLRREKQVWITEKNLKEKELSETRKELVKALAIMRIDENANNQETKDPKNESLVAEADFENQADPVQDKKPKVRRKLIGKYTPDVNQLNGKVSSPLLQAVITKKQLEREYLLKEASLRSSIDKLKAENELLRHSNSKSANLEPPQRLPQQPERLYEQWQPNRMKTHLEYSDSDTIALMQYKIEAQNEEIERLKQKFAPSKNSVNIEQAVASINKIPQALVTDVDEFLAKSKARFAEIELEAKSVELTFNKFHGKKEKSSVFPLLSDDAVLPIPERPKLPPPYPKSLFDNINSKKFEYFPKYLNPGAVRPPPIKEYKPILGSSVNHFGLPPPGFPSTSRSSGHTLDEVEPIVTRTEAPPLLEDREQVRAGVSTERGDYSPRPENHSNFHSTRFPTEPAVKVPKLTPSEVQINPRFPVPGPISEDKPNSDQNIDARISQTRDPYRKSDSEITQTQDLDIEAPVTPKEPKTPESKVATPRPVSVHQKRARSSGALVKDKVSSESELEHLDTNDLSINSTRSSVVPKEVPNVQTKPEPGPVILSWADILSGVHTSSLDSVPMVEKETIDDIGPIETSANLDDDEDFWNL